MLPLLLSVRLLVRFLPPVGRACRCACMRSRVMETSTEQRSAVELAISVDGTDGVLSKSIAGGRSGPKRRVGLTAANAANSRRGQSVPRTAGMGRKRRLSKSDERQRCEIEAPHRAVCTQLHSGRF